MELDQDLASLVDGKTFFLFLIIEFWDRIALTSYRCGGLSICSCFHQHFILDEYVWASIFVLGIGFLVYTIFPFSCKTIVQPQIIFTLVTAVLQWIILQFVLRSLFLFPLFMVFFFISIADDIPVTSSQETHGTSSVPRSDATDFPMLPENGQSNLEASSVYIPSDQMRMIQNINTILSEVCFLYTVNSLQA